VVFGVCLLVLMRYLTTNSVYVDRGGELYRVVEDRYVFMACNVCVQCVNL
jgi:hypothetical protein